MEILAIWESLTIEQQQCLYEMMLEFQKLNQKKNTR